MFVSFMTGDGIEVRVSFPPRPFKFDVFAAASSG